MFLASNILAADEVRTKWTVLYTSSFLILVVFQTVQSFSCLFLYYYIQKKKGKGMSLGCIQSLLGQLWNCQRTILLRATRGQWCKASHEEVQTWERHQVHGNLAQVAIQLARETQAAGDTAHGSRHQMVQVTISWGSQLQSAETNVV